ncbi:hypothetical protein DW782_12770 [Parabacteroides distasonis]|uniref:Uncharacterized protein n=1 Tax=Parabacteroides distasonis TaxID=823 RepID=A0A3R6GBN9_PARDI|nr:hypothetical protein DXC05_14165 [Parabacteroides distasonis]RGR34604.1 hypothetical protein DWY54_05820 [Parabacteroides distasonis]RHB87987.1 hypothetical protein DW867_14110 [Parabacteroides distasonis]RHD17809.1 hypothetical protein DW808_11110 [Parabacteroides distasonis]RHD74004.1 hypothetical protein DW782_12770 [Parabacteroides distasonis]
MIRGFYPPSAPNRKQTPKAPVPMKWIPGLLFPNTQSPHPTKFEFGWAQGKTSYGQDPTVPHLQQ